VAIIVAATLHHFTNPASRGSHITVSGTSENYYCVNTSTSVLATVGTFPGTKPSDCSSVGSASDKPGDYVLVTVTFTYTPINPDAVVTQMLQTKVTDSLGVEATYRFDVNGFVTDVTATQAQSRHIERTPGSHLPIAIVESVSTQGFTYDANGNVLSSTDATGHTTHFTYDPVFNKDPGGGKGSKGSRRKDGGCDQQKAEDRQAAAQQAQLASAAQ